MNDLNAAPLPMNSSEPAPIARQEVACEHCGMLGMCLEAGLSSDIRLLEQVVTRRDVLALNAVLYRAGDPFKENYTVKSGVLAAVAEDGHGGRKKTAFYFP